MCLTIAFKPNGIGSDAHLTEIPTTLQAKWPEKAGGRSLAITGLFFYSKLLLS